MSSEHSIWYRLGYALERAQRAQGPAARNLAARTERRPAVRGKLRVPSPDAWPPADQLLASGAVAIAAKVLQAWKPRHTVGWKGILKGGAAGAAAALALEVVRPLLEGRAELPELDAETMERILAGAAQGVFYGAVVEPRLPGPALVKGAVYGSAEYAVNPVGGLSGLLGSHAPLRRVPVLGAFIESLSPRDRGYLEHVAFGVALAVICGSETSSNGSETGVRTD